LSFGLGDLVVSLPAVQGLIRQGDATWLVARSAVQAAIAERIDGLSGVASTPTPSTPSTPTPRTGWTARRGS
jgi:hypothetical protein